MNSQETEQQKGLETLYNCHAHCFTLDHVPENFTRGYLFFPLKISWLRKSGILKWIIINLPRIIPWKADMMKRLSNLATYADVNTQEEIIEKLRNYYPASSKFVFLTMDLEYMDAGEVPVDFYKQLEELADLKTSSETLGNKIFPFLFVDPRRVNSDPDFISLVKNYIESKIYQGLKLYPPIGYYPFDKAFKPIYQFAIENNIPLMTHCVTGVVHNRGHKRPDWTVHPITGEKLPGTKASEYANNLAHPLNFECLLNAKILREFWGDETVDFSKLKICLGHFGGGSEWADFLNNPWLPDAGLTGDDSQINIERQWFKEKDFDKRYKTPGKKLKHNPFSWFSVVCHLITNPKYGNVYADISYTLSHPNIFPLLKVILESNKKIREQVLFGTDFYVVAKEGAERELCINLRGYLGEELFKQIAETNPKEFLRSKINPDV